jgi:hypothetical protein
VNLAIVGVRSDELQHRKVAPVPSCLQAITPIGHRTKGATDAAVLLR